MNHELRTFFLLFLSFFFFDSETMLNVRKSFELPTDHEKEGA